MWLFSEKALVNRVNRRIDIGRIHETLRVMPAMQAGIADHVWSVRELLEGA